MSTDFSKIWATDGTLLEPTDSQIEQGFGFLGQAPPSEGLFNWLFNDVTLKLQVLNNISRQWQASTAYSVGDIVYSENLSSYKYAKCTVAGTSNTTEPTWPAIGSTVTDGTVTWIVADIRTLPLTGGTMSGNIAMGSNKITGLSDAAASGDALNLGQFTANMASSGWLKIPVLFSGNKINFILQWATVDIASGTSGSIFSFPITFPLACLRAVVTDVGSTCYAFGAGNYSTSTITIWRTNPSGGIATGQYFALGY